jgi:hypothetical protein
METFSTTTSPSIAPCPVSGLLDSKINPWQFTNEPTL